MTDEHEDIRNFLENLPEKFSILEEGVDIQIQKEYISHSETFDRGELTENETFGLGNMLFEENQPLEKKKGVLVLLAHLGTIQAFRQIEKYKNYSHNQLKEWTLLALQECKMFLESYLLDESIGLISSGLGGLANRLRYFFLVLPLTNQSFTKKEKNIVEDEFILVCKDLNSILETVNFSDTFIGVTVLVPLDVAIGNVIETGIKKCNELGDFVFEYYYTTNANIPKQSEIIDIINIVREG